LCRALNIAARYTTGHLGDIGVPEMPEPMDFSAWFEAYLGGRWYTFDARDGLMRERGAVLESEDVLDHAYVHSLLRHRRSGQKVVALCRRGGSYATSALTP
jgi:hypothetical protein